MDTKLKRIALKILEEIENDFSNWDTLNELFDLDINKNYEVNKNESSDNYKQFTDQFGINHVVVAQKNKNDFIEIKAYPLKLNKYKKYIPDFDLPKDYDSMVLNTYIFIIINHYMNKYRKILLQPIDRHRHRLFRMCLNKYIDRSKWQMISNEKDLSIILMKTDGEDLKEFIKNNRE